MAIEEHGSGRQLVRFHVRPRLDARSLVVVGTLAVLAGVAALDGGWLASLVLGAGAGMLALRAFGETAGAVAEAVDTLSAAGAREQ